MGKALVLPNVNFSSNKLATVVIANDVPCTGISLSQATLTFAELSTETLTASVTPANTTDLITWESSDTSVATVSGGVVTAVGLGTANILATCGSQSAVCVVDVAIEYSGDDLVPYLHRLLSGTDISAGKDYIGTYTADAAAYRKMVSYFASAAPASGHRALSGTLEDYNGKYPIMIPKNATSIIIEPESGTTLYTTSGGTYGFLDSTQLSSRITTTADKGTKAITNLAGIPATNNKYVIQIPDDVDGLDSFAITAIFANEVSEAPDITISFA